LRLAMLRTHYHQPIDWTVKELERAQKDVREWYDLVNNDVSSSGAVDAGVIDALCDDLNTHTAIVRLKELARASDFATLRASLQFLGFSCDPSKLARRVSVTVSISGTSTVAGVGSVSVSTSDSNSPTGETKGQSEVTQHFTRDAEPAYLSIAPGTTAMFVVRGDGTIETDPATRTFIDDRIKRRNAARRARDFAEADRIRDELSSIGVAIKDNKDGATTWELKR